MSESHQKHAALTRPKFGTFARVELGILGTPCSNIQSLAKRIIESLKDDLRVSYIDADHKSGDEGVEMDAHGAAKQYTDKINFNRIDWKGELGDFQKKKLFLDQDLVLINGNHFEAQNQVIVLDSAKSLEKKLAKLTSPVLFLLKDLDDVPDYLQSAIPDYGSIPILQISDEKGIANWVMKFVKATVPEINGLVLAGGKSQRMQQDKTVFDYHGVPQREYARKLLAEFCKDVFISCRQEQVEEIPSELNPLPDRFVGLGPFGGIATALSHDPNKAWLAIASDLPLLDRDTIQFLIDHRNPSKIATCFLDSDKIFPEPLITIWEPRAYHELMFFMSMGHSCPRKTLINSDVEILEATDSAKFMNVNTPEDLEKAKELIQE